MTDPVILVPLDGSKNALCALPIARRLAELQKLAVRILHVTEAGDPLPEVAGRLGLEREHLRGATFETRAGDPAGAILAAAADRRARLIVMSAHAGEVRPAGGVGAVTLGVLKRASCPVVLVDPARVANDWTLRRLLVPHDGSPTVSGAVRPAAELARQAGAELVVLQASDAEGPEERGSIAPPRYMDQLQHAWPAWSGEFVQRLASSCQLDDMRVRLLVARGEPAAETIRVASEEAADLIAVVWQGPGEASPSLQAVLRDAPCPVMLTRVAMPTPAEAPTTG